MHRHFAPWRDLRRFDRLAMLYLGVSFGAQVVLGVFAALGAEITSALVIALPILLGGGAVGYLYRQESGRALAGRDGWLQALSCALISGFLYLALVLAIEIVAPRSTGSTSRVEIAQAFLGLQILNTLVARLGIAIGTRAFPDRR